MIIDILAAFLIGMGLLFFFGASLGLLRFPDFYTRMHAAGKGDTLSSLLVIAGVALHHSNEIFAQIDSGDWYKPLLLVLKLLAICLFIMLTSPTSTHALMEAGYSDGIDPNAEEDELANYQKSEEP